MLSHTGDLQGTPGRMGVRLIALFVLALALAGPLAVEMAPAVRGAGASTASKNSCGAATSAKPGCGGVNCVPVVAADYHLPATAPRGGARATLSRTSGVAGSTVSLTGSRWPAAAEVELRLAQNDGSGLIAVAPQPFAQGVADASGHVTIASFHTPNVYGCMTGNDEMAGDDQTLFVAQTPDSKARISLLFTFTPMPQFVTFANMDNWLVTSGASVVASGTGWEPGQTVTITPVFAPWPLDGSNHELDPSQFTPLPLAASSVKVIHDGSFVITLVIPPEPPESLVTYFATASGPRNGDVSAQLSTMYTILPQDGPTVSLSRDTAQAGGAVTVTGTNWPVGQAVQIEYCRHATTFCPPGLSEGLAVTRPSDGGGFTTTIYLPANARPGAITIQVRALSSPIPPGERIYNQTLAFMIAYPFAQAHPRVQMAINASPVAAAGLVIGLLALLEWRRKRRNLSLRSSLP